MSRHAKIKSLVAFSGKARCGKDTAARRLLEHYYFEAYSFAAPIKRALVSMFGFTFEHFEGSLKEADVDWLGMSPRRLMQTLGTEWGRDTVGEDVWVNTLEREILNERDLMGFRWHGAVISDCRMRNEAAWVRNCGGVVVHIDRPDAHAVANHITEARLVRMPGDVVIVNDGSLAEFKNKIDGLMAALDIDTGRVIANG